MFFLSFMAMLLAKGRLLDMRWYLHGYHQYRYPLVLDLRIEILGDLGLMNFRHTTFHMLYLYHYI